jgi:hypothetical protein
VTDGFKPLPGERGVRFGCGAIAGGVIGFLLAVRETSGEMQMSVMVAGFAALVLGVLAAAYGDRLWEGLSKVLWWIR